MKTRTRLIALLCTLVCILSMIVVPSAASSEKECGYTATVTCRTTGCKWLTEKLAETIAETANAAIMLLVYKAQRNPHADIERLCAETDAIAQNAIFLISLLGIEAKCVYEEYEINGETVLIDPIIVIKRDTTENPPT